MQLSSARQLRLVVGIMFGIAASALLATTPRHARAQSGTRSQPMQSAPRAAVGLEGYCPVCVTEMKKWVRGKSQFSAVYDGKTYLFHGEKQQQMFQADPAKYVPALGGDCTVCFAKMGKRMPGNIRHSARLNQRLFLFPGDAQKQEFLAHPRTYADVDLALEGKCAVCLAEMGKEVPGKPEVTAVYRGLRYQFPSPKERSMFLANPAKYAVRGMASGDAVSSRANREILAIRGTSSCAGCEHGVTPLGAPDTLGLAITADDGRVYIVEDAHRLYPGVYEDRFDALNLHVSGRVVKQSGNIAWIQPSELRVIN